MSMHISAFASNASVHFSVLLSLLSLRGQFAPQHFTLNYPHYIGVLTCWDKG